MKTEPGIDILNAGLGHMEIRFDPADPLETVRAERVIKDMLKRGYALFIEGADKKLTRVKRFMASHGCYVIADGPQVAPEGSEPDITPPPKLAKGEKAVSVRKVRTTAVGRSAGG